MADPGSGGPPASHDHAAPKVALIVVNWNGGELVEQCVEALLRQTLRPHQIIVVDNASCDGSAATIARRYADIRVITLDDNTGFAAANNVGLDVVDDCDWIGLVNPDALAEPDWLEQLLLAAREHQEYACFGSRMFADNERQILDGTGDVYHVSGLAWRRGHGRAARGRDCRTEEIFSPCAAAALYRKEALLAIGGFDSDYFCYFEDVDLGFRLRLLGYRSLYVADAVVRHVGSAISGQHSDFTIYHGHRNMVWTYFKDMPWPLFWLYLPQHLLLNIGSLLWFAAQGQGKVILRAKWDAFKGLPHVLRKRKRVQHDRRVGAWQIRGAMARGLLTPYLTRIG